MPVEWNWIDKWLSELFELLFLIFCLASINLWLPRFEIRLKFYLCAKNLAEVGNYGTLWILSDTLEIVNVNANVGTDLKIWKRPC